MNSWWPNLAGLAGRARPAARRPRRLPLLLAAAAVLALGWLVAPHPVPLYDGVGMPDEPYRYVVPPAGYRSTPPVTEARTRIDLSGGVSCCELEARSGEQGPQVALYVPRGGLRAPGAGPLDVVAQAAAPPAGPPPVEAGKYEGNLYRVSARSPAGPAVLTPAGEARATFQLRALNGNSPGPKMYFRPTAATPWRELPTGKVGFDIYESQFVGPGDYVLVRAKGGSGSTVTVLLGILAVPVLLIVALVALRLRGGPAPDDDEDGEESAEDGEESAEDGDRAGGGGGDSGAGRRESAPGG